MDEQRLKSVALFASLSKRELRQLARCADEVDVEAGKRLVTEGDFAYEAFVIEDGTAEVTRHGERVAVLGPGDVFGEMGVVDRGAIRSADVVAATPMRLVVMTGRDFRETLRELPEVAERVRAEIERRARPLGEDG